LQHLYKAARSGMDIILSTGASTLAEIDLALSIILSGYNNEKVKKKYNFHKIAQSSKNRRILLSRVTLLHCVSSYPVPDQQLNLKSIQTIKSKYGLKTGYSDHSKEIIPSVLAICLGAEVIEKHLTLNNDAIGPDHKASLNPTNFRKMVIQIRKAEKMLGDGIKVPQICEIQNRKVIRRSLVAAEDMSAQTKVTWDNVDSLRLTKGIPTEYLAQILGKKFRKDVKKGQQLKFSDFI